MKFKLNPLPLFLFVALSALLGPRAMAVSPDIVISQVYGGAGCSTANCSTYQNDFIELFNRSSSAMSVNGWSVQYAAAAGSTWQVTNLPNVSIPAGGYLLVAEASSANGVSPLPTPNATGSIAMSATAGKVALLDTTTALTGTCPASTSIIDLVGYGATSTCSETANAPAPSTTTADIRAASGCTDTDDNSSDFSALTPNPRNSGTTVHPCTPSTPTPTATGTPSPTPTATATATPTGTPTAVRIHDIQGAAHLSPMAGQTVTSIPGIVTAKVSNGFYLQDPSPDSNDATSEGIFVFTSSVATVSVGDAVTVSGTVTEFRPGGSGSTSLTTTEISSPGLSVVVQSTANPLPTPVVIGIGGRIPPSSVIEDDVSGSVETGGVFDPASDGIDFYESLECMRVQINNAVVTGPSNSFGEIPVLSDDGANATGRTTRGGIAVQASDFNPERILLDDVILATPVVNVGDHFTGPIVGVMDYSFGNFKLEFTQAITAVSGGLARETTASQVANEIAIATFNVENLDPTDPPTKFSTLASLIVNNLKSPDIVTLEEIQDNNGATNDAVVDATTTFNTLISAIQSAGGPTYTFRQINPVDDQDGGEPGGNIRVGFLFRTDRGLSFIDRAGGCSTCSTTVTTGESGVQLSFSPGRIDPTNAAFNSSRKPLAGEFTFGGQKFFVIANHFNSKGGDDPLFGRFQPPTLSSETQRTQQAQIVNNFVDSILALDANAKIVVLGDLNDFQFSTPLTTLKGGVLHDLIETLPLSEQYTYVFEGNSQALDHILVSDSLFSGSFGYDVVHVNSEFSDQASDHDPQVVRLTLGASPTPTPTATATATATPTATATSTPTATATAIVAPTATATATSTPTATVTATVAPTATATATATTPPATPTATATATATPSATSTATATATAKPTATATASSTATATPNSTAAASATATATATPTATPTVTPAQALNISTRLRVATGDKVLFGGFIITGNAPKPVVLRGLGPSLAAARLPAASLLNDPVLELHGGNGDLITSNDNWKESPQKSQIEGTLFEPSDDREAVILATLTPGAYTVVLKGSGETTGIGLMEIYDNDQAVDSAMANISTRGFVETGNDVLIGGFILGGGTTSTHVAVRALGPSLASFGLTNLLSDPTLELHDANGAMLITNDDWQSDSTSAAQLDANGLGLPSPKESGIFTSLPAGQFTAIVAGKNGMTGIAVVEIYNLQ
jgi:uncharacterized protein